MKEEIVSGKNLDLMKPDKVSGDFSQAGVYY